VFRQTGATEIGQTGATEMTLSFMIKRKYLTEKVAEQTATGSFHERRARTPFWRKRIGSTHKWHLGGEAVFLCGRDVYRADVLRVAITPTPAGLEDVISTALCYDIECRFGSVVGL